MSSIYLIRHGQASLGKSNYDALSDLGHQQAVCLGEYFSHLGIRPDQVIQGDLVRHQETTSGIIRGFDTQAPVPEINVRTDARWNEFNFEALIRLYIQQHQVDTKGLDTPGKFFGVLKQALLAWSSDCLSGELPESWLNFESRIRHALEDAIASDTDATFIVSSGGAISMAIKHVLALNNTAMIELNLQSRNSGVSELVCRKGRAYVSCLNHVSHLSSAEKKSMITHA